MRSPVSRASTAEVSKSPPQAQAPRPPPPRGRPPGSFTQHRRLDELRSLLQRNPKGLSIYDLAEKLKVTPRSLRRYLLEVQHDLELVSYAPRPGGPKLWRLSPNDLPRRVEVRRTQAYALLAARRLFDPLRGSTLYEEIDLATKNLIAVARRPGRGPNAGVSDERLDERFLYLPFAPKDYAGHATEIDDLYQAVADLRPLRCRYRIDDGTEEAFTIHPYAMVLYKETVVAVGVVVVGDAPSEVRTFLLDRMRDTQCLTRERFKLPKDFRVDDYFQGQFGIASGADRQRVVVDFDAKVAEFVRTRRVHVTQELTPRAEGGVRLTLHVSDLSELATWVLGFGALARVLEPAELVERVRAELAGALAQYASSAEPSDEAVEAPLDTSAKPRRA